MSVLRWLLNTGVRNRLSLEIGWENQRDALAAIEACLSDGLRSRMDTVIDSCNPMHPT